MEEGGGTTTGTAKQVGLLSPAKITTILGKYSLVIGLASLSPTLSSSSIGLLLLEEEGGFWCVQTNESNAKAINKTTKKSPPKRYGTGDFQISTGVGLIIYSTSLFFPLCLSAAMEILVMGIEEYIVEDL